MHYIYSTNNTVEAHLIVHALAERGIIAQIHGEFQQRNNFASPAIDDVRISVSSQDYESALALIKAHENEKKAGLSQQKKSDKSALIILLTLAAFIAILIAAGTVIDATAKALSVR